MQINITLDELAAILAGLRMLQEMLDDGPYKPEIDGVLTNEGTMPGLTPDEIDELCERLSTESNDSDGQPDEYTENQDFAQDGDFENMSAADIL